ncbi:multicopper oxidase family protein [Mycobacterium paraseoulense]|uniref:Copper oxidase n=1 Tax=Mycobacterium paraseoulense TaxID=590652 RepID=A0A1X0ICT1_9MYCO|nr:multicopper oxidase domain-containing protein [Mycobacterium paraseoulense]MCV7393343.1 multicopper oxidase domain-containing protein [Mycobacterium paraseoulense]ORB43026.1 copper oxidase [Mycobacterium paraseoulense]BBZ69441.1 multicopper oxidase MmcO [Mycobacterium paraseoulense]
MSLDRRDFFRWGGLAALAASGAACAHPAPSGGKADYTLRIGTGAVELAPGHVVSTLTYNGQFPGPLLRFTQGRRTTVDVFNDTDSPEQLHWHGQHVGVDVDGSAEEGTPYVPARGMRRVSFVPGPAGFRFYHTHVVPRADLSRGQYSGLVGPVYIEPKQNFGAYDQEIFLTLKEFEPSFVRGGDMAAAFLAGDQQPDLKDRGESSMAASLGRGDPRGFEVSYGAFAVNGRMLGHGDPIRVRTGQRVLLHVLNGSATETRSLALPGHTFTVVALDGNPVPNPAPVPVLWLGAAERISALVSMTNPGVWVLGDVSDDDREHGMGVVVEYAGRAGDPQWAPPPPFTWDYRLFARPAPVPPPDHTIELLIEKRNAADNGFNVWTFNGTPFSMNTNRPVLNLERDRRYRLRFRNASDDLHPMHLHRHTFEITRFAGAPTAGVRKDVAMLGGYQSMDVDFVADQPGLSLLHCHQQIHMDYGLMLLLDAG